MNHSSVHLVPRITTQEANAAHVARLERALAYARALIESYQMDIRNSTWTGVDLVAVGFCQGVIYRDALADIDALLREAG